MVSVPRGLLHPHRACCMVQDHLLFSAYPVMITDPESNDWPRTRTVSLFCEVEGNPKPNILWYFNGTLIHQVEKSKIKYEVGSSSIVLKGY